MELFGVAISIGQGECVSGEVPARLSWVTSTVMIIKILLTLKEAICK
jgi:hypothetical protein